MRHVASKLDMYRKVPIDLLEGTKRGSYLSYAAIITMLVLFIMETKAFLSSRSLVTDVALDTNEDSMIRINFNVTMMDLKCEYTVVDVVSKLGTQQNVTSHISKFSLDANGVRERYKGRNKFQHDIVLGDESVVESIEELHENGEDVINLDAESLEYAKEFDFLFVDFYASWCSHCRHLAPTWEVLAEIMTEVARDKFEKLDHDTNHPDYTEEWYQEALNGELPVMVAKVDCVEHKRLCDENMIMGYPTLRLFVEGEWHGDYKGDRTILEMVHWLTGIEHEYMENHDHKVIAPVDKVARERLGITETKEEMLEIPKRSAHSAEQEEWTRKINRQRNRQKAAGEWKDEDHPGCQVSGYIWTHRVPGNFHIMARSNHHDIVAHMTNVSHEVHELSFGNPSVEASINRKKIVTPDGFVESMRPMDGNVYVNHDDHQAFHHYLKVVTSHFDDEHMKNKPSKFIAYQLLSSSQLSYYRNDIVPEAKFTYDLSPIAVHHRYEPKIRWYDYITSVMAIVGGTFTVIGMLENSINAVMRKKK